MSRRPLHAPHSHLASAARAAALLLAAFCALWTLWTTFAVAAEAQQPAAGPLQPWQVVPSGSGLSRPVMPDSTLDPPASVVPVLFAYAQGVQRYICVEKPATGGTAGAAATPSAAAPGAAAAPSASFAWTLKEPQAKLFDRADHEIGEHSAGPSWQLKDGSKVVKKKVVSSVPALESDGVPWLLVQVEPSGKGALANVQYVQRVDTVGGAAPATGCAASNAKATLDVEYRATYVFYAPPQHP